MHGPEHLVEFFHGYTYSGHPLACAAGLAALEVYRDEDLFARARQLEAVLADAVHDLRGEPNVIDIRSFGLAAAVELSPRADGVSLRAMEVFDRCFEQGVMLRYTSDILVLGPAATASEDELGILVDTLRQALRAAR
jgi:beta-alanine--pyruvate transaminase